MSMNTSSFKKTLLVSCVSLLALSACGTTNTAAAPEDNETSKINQILARAADKAAAQGEEESSLFLLERAYKRDSDNPQAALRYANALRQFEYLNRAAIVLAPFARDPESSADIKNEFSAIQLALGNYSNAEEFAQQAIMKDSENYMAFHYLGIALDAQGMHTEAERAFRKGLDFWQGDPTAIMNNLALNLASQGHISEAKSILEKALSVAPERSDIERNLRIVSALQEKEPDRPREEPKEEKKEDKEEKPQDDDKEAMVDEEPEQSSSLAPEKVEESDLEPVSLEPKENKTGGLLIVPLDDDNEVET